MTGAGGGLPLGRAFCLELAKRRARLVVSDVRQAAAEETARLAREAGASEAHASSCATCSKPKEVEALADDSYARLGGVDVLVNNAGVASSGPIGENSGSRTGSGSSGINQWWRHLRLAATTSSRE